MVRFQSSREPSLDCRYVKPFQRLQAYSMFRGTIGRYLFLMFHATFEVILICWSEIRLIRVEGPLIVLHSLLASFSFNNGRPALLVIQYVNDILLEPLAPVQSILYLLRIPIPTPSQQPPQVCKLTKGPNILQYARHYKVLQGRWLANDVR